MAIIIGKKKLEIKIAKQMTFRLLVLVVFVDQIEASVIIPVSTAKPIPSSVSKLAFPRELKPGKTSISLIHHLPLRHNNIQTQRLCNRLMFMFRVSMEI